MGALILGPTISAARMEVWRNMFVFAKPAAT